MLSSGSLPACCRDMSEAKISLVHNLCCSLRLYSQPWVVTLHFLMPSFHSHCLKHCISRTVSCGYFNISLTVSAVSLFVLTKNPFPTLAYVNRLHGGKTHSCHTVSIRQKVSYCPTPGRSTQLTVKLRVNGGK